MRKLVPGVDVVARDLRQRVRAALAGRRDEVRVGRYTLGERLGVGGMGVVFRGRDPVLERDVAVKLIPLAASRSPDAMLREAKAMAKVVHPNVVEVFDLGVTDTELFIVMQLVEGQSLRQWLDTSPSYHERLRVLRDAGRGLEAAHRMGVVHHDFKPDNVLISADGEVFVIDFGLAALSEEDTLETAGAAEVYQRDVGGTLGYAAPERCAGNKGDALCDQYSWCVSAGEVLYGAVRSADQTFSALSPVPQVGRVPLRIRRALERGLRTQPTARFERLTPLLRALDTGWRPSARLALLGVFGVLVGSVALLSGGQEPPRRPSVVRTGIPRIDLHARLQLGGAWDQAGDVENALAVLEALYPVAASEHEARIATKAATTLVWLHWWEKHDAPAARRWVKQGEAALDAGGDDLDAGALYYNAGATEVSAGELDAGRSHLETALAYDEGERGPGDRSAVATMLSLANLDLLQGDYEVAEARLDAAQGYIPESARDLLENVESLRASLLLKQARYGEALRAFAAVVDYSRDSGGIPLAYALANQSRALGIVGRVEDARAASAEGLAIIDDTLGPMSVRAVHPLSVLAEQNHRLGNFDEARVQASRAVVILESEYGADHAELAGPLHLLGQVALEQSRPRQAAKALQRSVALRKQHGARPAATAATLMELARALHSISSERALAAAEEAVEVLERGGLDSAKARGVVADISREP